jgi:hypothetical protein
MTLAKPILIATLMLASCCFIDAQQSREEGVKAIKRELLDVPTATYKLEAAQNGRGYQFCNTSVVRVVTFRLGCVEKKNSTLKILNERVPQPGDPAPAKGDSVECRFWDCNDCFFPGEACKKGKLAITAVELADGNVWKLKQ